MTGDHADGSRKGMRAIPLTQRQRKQLKPAETPARLTDAAPHTSGHKRRAPRHRAPQSASLATPLDSTSETVISSASGAATAAPAPRARATAPKPTALRPTATAAAPASPARARRPAEPQPAPSQAPEASAPRRTQRRPPPSVTPVSPLDLVDTAPLVAPASLRLAPALAPRPEPELAETTRLKLPRGAPFAPRGAAAPVDQIDLVDTAQLAPPVETIDTTHLPPTLSALDAVDAVDAVDTAPLVSFMPPAPAQELAVTSRLNARRAAKGALPASALDSLDDVETAPLALGVRPAPAAIDTMDTTQLSPLSALEAIDTTQLVPPVDAVDTTQLTPPETANARGVEPLFAPPDLPVPAYRPALTHAPVDAIDTTQLAPPLDMIDTTYLATPVDQVETAQLSSPLADADTTLLAPRPTAPAAGLDSWPSAPSDPGAPRRVKVRVRRKRAGGLSEDSDPAQAAVQAPASLASAASALADEETAILPPLQDAPQPAASSLTLNIIDGAQTSQLVTTATPLTPPALSDLGDLPETTLLTLPATAPEPAPVSSAVSPALETQEAAIVETPAFDATDAIELRESVAPATDAAEADTEPLAPPEPIAAASEQTTATADDTPAPVAPVAPTPAAPVVTTRKLPTLAVMAALASRAEARAEAETAEAPQAPAAPEESRDRDQQQDAQAATLMSERASDPGSSLADEDTDKLRIPFVAAAPADDASVSNPAPSLWTSENASAAPQSASQSAPHGAAFLSDPRDLMGSGPPTQPRPRATRPGAGLRQTPGLASSDPAAGTREDAASVPDASAADVETGAPDWRMWWQSAPERGQTGRASRPPSVSQPSAPSAPRGWRGGAPADSQPLPGHPGVRSARIGVSSPRWAASGAHGATPEPAGWGGYAAHESDPGALLVWTGGAQAALAGMAALIAALALLNGGPRALGVFTWAISFALVAGIGAGLGHLAWRARQPKRATLAITLSHLGLLVWALALLGPLPALMSLAPVTLALTLRGLGRMVTVVTAAAIGAFYLVALSLSAAGAWPFASGALAPLILNLLNGLLIAAGVGLGALALMSLYASGERERARVRAITRDAALATSEIETLRAQTEDDADALRRALSAALRGRPVERAGARGALSPLAEQVNITGERLAELSYDREARKRLEGATRRLIRNMERAWLGLSWEWPEASGVILDDLIALLRTPPPSGAERLPEESTPTGQVVAPHLYRAGQPGISFPSQPLQSQPARIQPGLWPARSYPSQPSGVWPALWPSDPEPAPPGVDPLALPPAPRWGESSDPRLALRPPSAPSFPYPGALDGETDNHDHPDHQDMSGLDGWHDANGLNSADGHNHLNGDRPE